VSDFSFYHDHGYDRIAAYGFSRGGEPGAPELPVVYLNYIIPPDAKVDSLIILQVNIKQISGAYLVYPAQPPQIPGESIPWIEPDSLYYNSDELFPDRCMQVMGDGVLSRPRSAD
jgi:hypothetical protein